MKKEKKLYTQTTLKNGKLKGRKKVNGKYYYRRADSPKELREWAMELEKLRCPVKPNRYKDISRVPLIRVYRDWWEWYTSKGKKPSPGTLRHKKEVIKLLEPIHEMPFHEIRTKAVLKCWEKRKRKLGRDFCSQDKQRVITLLGELNVFAQDKERSNLRTMLEFNPKNLQEHFKRYKAPVKKSKDKIFLQEELDIVTEYLAVPQYINIERKFNGKVKKFKRKKYPNQKLLLSIWLLFITLGPRGSELCALKRGDYNAQEGTLTFNSTLSNGGAGIGYIDRGETKTREPREIENLDDIARDSIEYLLSLHDGLYIVPLTIKNSKGNEHTNINNLNRLFKGIFKACGVKHLPSHKFGRTTLISHLFKESQDNNLSDVESGEHIKEFINHQNLSTTLGYAQIFTDNIEKEMGAVTGRNKKALERARAKVKNKNNT